MTQLLKLKENNLIRILSKEELDDFNSKEDFEILKYICNEFDLIKSDIVDNGKISVIPENEKLKYIKQIEKNSSEKMVPIINNMVYDKVKESIYIYTCLGELLIESVNIVSMKITNKLKREKRLNHYNIIIQMTDGYKIGIIFDIKLRTNMYRETKYIEHNISLDEFSKIFNNCNQFKEIIIKPIEKETYQDDGCIVDLNTGKEIIFDWEKRAKKKNGKDDFANGVLKYPTLGQYERKLKKNQIKLSIQCDTTETAVAIGWHEDFLKEDIKHLKMSTDQNEDEDGKARYTKDFKIYKYEKNDIVELKRMIKKSFDNNTYNKQVF